jgi:hypothetical protein
MRRSPVPDVRIEIVHRVRTDADVAEGVPTAVASSCRQRGGVWRAQLKRWIREVARSEKRKTSPAVECASRGLLLPRASAGDIYCAEDDAKWRGGQKNLARAILPRLLKPAFSHAG